MVILLEVLDELGALLFLESLFSSKLFIKKKKRKQNTKEYNNCYVKIHCFINNTLEINLQVKWCF